MRTLTLIVCLLAAAPVLADDGGDWPMFNRDVRGSRYNAAEHHLRRDTVRGLRVLWTVPTPRPVTATPVVRDHHVYVGDSSGTFYSIGHDGKVQWSTVLHGPDPMAAQGITATALVTARRVVIGDLGGYVYGLDRATGKVVWTLRPDAHPVSSMFGSPIAIGDDVLFGVASLEEQAAAKEGYPCCSTRGSVVRARADDGRVVWQTFTITDAERAAGASGATVWSTPTYDAESGLVYVTTGNNFSTPATGTSDAVIALEACSGHIVWVNQRLANDVWNYRYPPDPIHPDFDFGDSPQIYRLPCGRKVVGAGQKSGFYHVVDAETGVAINQWQVTPGGPLGGLFADSAVADGIAYTNGTSWPSPSAGLPEWGALVALGGPEGTTELWRFTTPGSPDMSGVAVTRDLVVFQSWLAGTLYVLDRHNGALLTSVSIGRAVSGPSIAGGRIYVGTGDAIFGTDATTGSVVALGLADD
jgi:polyvinyl alcohol dehydrogenase (cytochrome)